MKARQKPIIVDAKTVRAPLKNDATDDKFCERVKRITVKVIIPRIFLMFFFDKSIFYSSFNNYTYNKYYI
jgi:hypothetical protein